VSLFRIRPIIAACSTPGGCSFANSPVIIDKLKTVSAGHTACVPESIDIANVKAARDGSGTWNASCGGRAYLCCAVATVGHSESCSRAPAVQ
jgi:hypothetical protein